MPYQALSRARLVSMRCGSCVNIQSQGHVQLVRVAWKFTSLSYERLPSGYLYKNVDRRRVDYRIEFRKLLL